MYHFPQNPIKSFLSIRNKLYHSQILFSSLKYIFLFFYLAIIENIYDPLSLKQTTNLVKTIEHIFETYPTMTDDSKTVKVIKINLNQRPVEQSRAISRRPAL